MRETLVACKNDSTFFTKIPSIPSTDLSIKTVLTNSDKRLSIELCANRYFNTDILCEIPHSFCSVTWFSPSIEELENVENIPAIQLAKRLRLNGYSVLLHVTGRNLKKYQVLRILQEVKNAGVRNILALQGDPSRITEKYNKKCDFPYASDLVKFIRSCYGQFFTIGVAGYPEKHPGSENMTTDLDHLKYKVSCGADFILTQASYNYSTFSNFVQKCRSIGIHIPIIPGIFVISSYRTLMAMSNFCGVPVPKHILNIVENNKDNNIAVKEFGTILAVELVKKIMENGNFFGGIHVFTLNNMELLRDVSERVGVIVTVERPLKYYY